MQLQGFFLAVGVLASSCPAQAQVRASRLRQLFFPPPPLVVLPATTQWLTVQIKRVVDADTYEVESTRGRARVRLLGADAPETNQPFGRQATDSVVRVLRGRTVQIQPRGLDAFGRNLAAVRLRPAAFRRLGPVALDSLLVVRGWAWAASLTRQPAARIAEQRQAQAAGRGLWKCGRQGPVAPGVWRGLTKEARRGYWRSCSW